MSSNQISNQVRVRFAPSPTGYLHVGGARTALYDFLYAQRKKGQLILRIEDTDQERSTEESLRMQIQDLEWLGLHWDEGPDPKTLEDRGPYAPYRQSQRLSIYKEQAQKLINAGKAFYCFLKEDEIDSLRENAKQAGINFQLKSPYRDLPLEQALKKLEAGESAVVRFKSSDQNRVYTFQDLVRGEIQLPSDVIGDFVLLRADGMPVYNFCCVVDDGLMKITHVLRAEEHLNNTLRQLMLYEALNWPLPQFGHLSLILGEDRQKLSKRHGATSVHQYMKMGYLPEALKNYLALLGWSSPEGQEILSEKELCQQFDLDRLNSSPAVFDEKKLKWVNATHLRALPHSEIWKQIQPRLNEAHIEVPIDESWRERALELFKPYMETFNDAVTLFEPIGTFNITEEAQEPLGWESSPLVIKTWVQLLQKFLEEKSSSDNHQQGTASSLSSEDFANLQNQVKTQANVKGKFLFMPLRVAVVGKPHGADLAMLAPLLPIATLIDRAAQVLNHIHSD